MALSVLKRFFVPEEFIIDEPPEPIFELDLRVGETPTDAAAESPSDPAADPDRCKDVLSEVGRLMLEQVRLQQQARSLENDDGRDDEFARFVKQALPFLDNFWRILELAREHPPSEELQNWLASVESLYFRIIKLLDSHGLIFMNSLGKEVNLDYHDIVEYRTTSAYPHNYVIKELERGVVFRERLLRDAKVVVACQP